MSLQKLTYTSFENVSGRSNRLHLTSLQPFSGFLTISAELNSEHTNLQFAFEGHNSNGDRIIDLYWYSNRYTIDLHSVNLTNVTQFDIWIRFDNNNNISASDLDSIVCTVMVDDGSGWYMTIRNRIENNYFIKDVSKYLEEPYPVSIWQCDELVDNGMAHVPLFPDAVKIDPHPVKQSPYIVIYDIRTPQSQLAVAKNNGQAILTPTLCEDTEELCGMWSLQLEHPIDPEHRWKLIQEGNIIRAGGQLYTIKQTEEIWEGASGRVTAYCEHIWYQYGDNWIFADPINIIAFTSRSTYKALENINTRLTEKTYVSGGIQYAFNFEGNREGFQFGSLYNVALDAGCTPIDLILGDNGIIPTMGGELHRDNFYYSIYDRKEGAKDNAFDIRIGKNLTGIKRTVDTTTLCTYYRLTDSVTGMWQNLGWDTASYASSVWRNYLPHHIVRSEIITIPQTDEKLDRFEYLNQIAIARFSAICMPIICYEINIEDVRQNPDFEFSGEESIRAGDTGIVYDERMGGALTLEVTSTVYDRITGKCKSFTVGNNQSFVWHNSMSYLRDENGNRIYPSQLGYELWVQDSTGRYLYDSTGRKIIITKEDDE